MSFNLTCSRTPSSLHPQKKKNKQIEPQQKMNKQKNVPPTYQEALNNMHINKASYANITRSAPVAIPKSNKQQEPFPASYLLAPVNHSDVLGTTRTPFNSLESDKTYSTPIKAMETSLSKPISFVRSEKLLNGDPVDAPAEDASYFPAPNTTVPTSSDNEEGNANGILPTKIDPEIYAAIYTSIIKKMQGKPAHTSKHIVLIDTNNFTNDISKIKTIFELNKDNWHFHVFKQETTNCAILKEIEKSENVQIIPCEKIIPKLIFTLIQELIKNQDQPGIKCYYYIFSFQNVTLNDFLKIINDTYKNTNITIIDKNKMNNQYLAQLIMKNS